MTVFAWKRSTTMPTHNVKLHLNLLFRSCCNAAVTLACFLMPTTTIMTQHLKKYRKRRSRSLWHATSSASCAAYSDSCSRARRMQRWRAAKYASCSCSARVDGERLILLSLCVAASTHSTLNWQGLDWARWSGDGDAVSRHVAVRCCCVETKGLHVASSLSLHCSQARASSRRSCMALILSETLHETSIVPDFRDNSTPAALASGPLSPSRWAAALGKHTGASSAVPECGAAAPAIGNSGSAAP